MTVEPITKQVKELEEFFGTRGLLASALGGFEYRVGQLDMAKSVIKALLDKKYLMVEAGTGTGKTLAYLVPILLSKRKTVVSTGTKNLQEQLLEKDIPIIERAYTRNIKAVNLKGRRNYLCLRRFNRFRSQGLLEFKEDVSLFKVIEGWAKKTGTGDRAEIEGLPDSYAPWNDISSSPDTCVGQKCPHFETCFVNRARRKAKEADIVVVNHHLFFADLGIRQRGGSGVIPRYEAVIFDEAHNLEEVSTSYFGVMISPFRLEELVRDLLREMGYEGKTNREVEGAALKVRDSSDSFFKGIVSKAGEGKRRIEKDFFGTQELRRITALKDRLSILRDKIKAMEGDTEHLLSVARRCDEILDDIDFVVTMPDSDYVFWYDRRGRGIFLGASPIHVARELENSLYKDIDTLVFTSATLAVAGNFDFFQSSLGIDGGSEKLVIESGFDLANQGLLFVPDSLPAPDRAGFATAVAKTALMAINSSPGGALLLFTSKKNMNEVHRILKDRLERTVMLQGEAPRNIILKKFQEDKSSVLFATASFWEGVDVPGEALSLVIIDKLPFDSPSDPIVEAKMEYMKGRDRNPFLEYQVPRAVISLRQGLGRLIRSGSDRGVMGIFDSRLHSRRYGNIFFESLSAFRTTVDIEDVRNFFQ